MNAKSIGAVAVSTALTTVMTCIMFPLPEPLGYVNLGEVAIFIFSLLMGPLALVEAPVVGALAAAQIPKTVELIERTGEARFAGFAPMSFARAYARGVGMLRGAADGIAARLRRGRTR